MATPDNCSKLVNFDVMSRLTIEIDPEQHRKIKTLATFAGMTLKEFILAHRLIFRMEDDRLVIAQARGHYED